MQIQLFNIFLAFLEGFALIISPCILPILPIILSGSLQKSHKRPLGIMLGFVITFAFFTLFARLLVQHFSINLELTRQFAYIFLIIFGIIIMSDYLSEKFAFIMQKTTSITNPNTNHVEQDNESTDFISGVWLGFLISLIWVPCAGPILAAAIIQSAIQKTNLQSFLIFLSFAVGSIVPMMLIAFLGRQFLNKFHFLKTHAHIIRKCLGAIIIITTLFLAFSEWAPMTMPKNLIAPKEDKESIKENTRIINSKKWTDLNNAKPINQTLMNALPDPYPAPEIKNSQQWMNSPPLNIKELKGKVILIDFWTYSCINCVRTIPHLNEWYKKYKDQGFVIIGIHSPEFEFEKNPTNVQNAISKLNIQYPVALDNEYATWLNYDNHYWPAQYLIDKTGRVVYQHFGEGDEEIIEHNIRTLLGPDKKEDANLNTNNITEKVTASTNKSLDSSRLPFSQTPEIYLGSERSSQFVHGKLTPQLRENFTFPNNLPLNQWALNGSWTIEKEKIISNEKNASIRLHFNARKVYAVMGIRNKQSLDDAIPSSPIHVQILFNYKPLKKYAGKDVREGEIMVNQNTLYEILDLPEPTEGTLELIISDPNLELYTFTFG